MGYLAAAQSDARAESQIETAATSEGQLKISDLFAGRIAGSYADEGSVVSFSSQRAQNRVTRSDRASQTGAPQRVTARVEVNGKSFVWTSDLETHSFRFDGPDTTLTQEDVRLLDEAGTALWRSLLRGDVSKDKLPLEQKMLTVTFGYLSEAPVGYRITDKVGSTEVTGVEGSPKVAKEASLQGVAGRACREAALKSGDFAALAGCERPDNDGITRLTCESKMRNESHDAESASAKRHCFQTVAVYSGPCSRGCLGQCGAGCNGAGTFGGYFQDCLDHDRCSRHHNASGGSSSRVCGDEYDEAIGDFIAGMKGGCGSCRR